MNEKTTDVWPPDGDLFNANINKIPAEEMLRHAGKRVAYSWDGTRIVASGRDDSELEQALNAAGIGFDEVVWGYIPREDEDILL